MMYSHCEILFPHSKVSGLKNFKGEDWKALVEEIASLPETDPDALAFSHMMIKVCDCLNCDLSSYKAALGCAACSQRTINALRDTDKQMIRRFKKSQKIIDDYLDEIEVVAEKTA
ncbi:MAG: hypothetical protein AAF629_34850 [Chloroflexota bacterium]